VPNFDFMQYIINECPKNVPAWALITATSKNLEEIEISLRTIFESCHSNIG